MKTKKVCVFVCVEQQNVQLNTATVSLNKQLWVRLLWTVVSLWIQMTWQLLLFVSLSIGLQTDSTIKVI